MKSTAFLIAALVPSVMSTFAFAQTAEPTWWGRRVLVERLQLPEDPYCRGSSLIGRLKRSGLPINSELYPVVKGKDITLGINPTFSKTKKVWIEVPRETPWQPLPSSPRTCSVSQVIRHFSREAGEYRLVFVESLPVLLPQKGQPLSEQILCASLSAEGTTLYDIADRYGVACRSHGVGFRFSRPGSAEYGRTLRFDIIFGGGPLKNLLTKVVSELNSVDPAHFYFWNIGGLEGQEGIEFGRIPVARLESLLVDESKHN